MLMVVLVLECVMVAEPQLPAVVVVECAVVECVVHEDTTTTTTEEENYWCRSGPQHSEADAALRLL